MDENYRAMSLSTTIVARETRIMITTGIRQSVKVTELTTFVRLSTYKLKAKLIEKSIAILAIQQRNFTFFRVEVFTTMFTDLSQGNRNFYVFTFIPKSLCKHPQRFWEAKLKILGRKLRLYID